MANALNRSPANRRIDIYDPEEVDFWCREFDVMPVDLISVVVAVGPLVDDVKAELGGMGCRVPKSGEGCRTDFRNQISGNR